REEPITLRREVGTLPIEIGICGKPDPTLGDSFHPLVYRPLNERSTLPMPGEKEEHPPRIIDWVLHPGESKTYFVPIRKLFDIPPQEDRVENCSVSVYPGGVLPT